MKPTLKQLLLITAFFSMSTSVISQHHLSPQWLTHSVGEKWDLVSHMLKDTAGNLYITGNFSGTTTAEKDGRSISGERDLFIAAYDSNGINKWFHKLSSPNYCYISSIAYSDDGEFYICGYFRETFSIGGNSLCAPTHSAMFIAGIDEMGNVSWVKQLDADFKGRPVFLGTGPNKKLYLAATFGGKLQLDEMEYTSINGDDILLAAFDNEGQLTDTLFIEGENELKDFQIQDNHLYLAGRFRNELHINQDSLISKGRDDAFFVKLDTALQTVIVKQIGSIYDDFGAAIRMDRKGNIIFAGSHKGELELPEGFKLDSINGSYDVFVCKYNASGKLMWANNFGGPADDILKDAALNSYNDIYLMGSYRGEIEKDESLIKSENFSSDIFIAKYTANGEFRYLESIGDTNTDLAQRILVSNDNMLLVAGNFTDNLEILGMESDSAIGSEYFLTMLYDCDFSPTLKLPADTGLCAKSFVIIADSGFTEYYWNGLNGSNEYIVDTTGMYILETFDKHNCFSIDTIIVSVNPPPEVDIGEDRTVLQGENLILYAGAGFEEYLWSTNDTDPYLEISTSDMNTGEYLITVLVTNTNHCTNKATMKLEVVSPVRINTYPNPATEKLLVQIMNLEPDTRLELQLYSVEGDFIWNEECIVAGTHFEQHLNLHTLNRGTYYLRVKYDDVVEVVRVVKM
ncbi:MAG: hypothetical protein DRJ05_06350 [Bacteroidetes bacterium]|nr:MAG: hypothetical protein DRJ05_06350 [Bacteroidota bacterium]